MTRDITTKTHRQHVINEEPLHDDLSSATAEMDVMVSNQETVKKLTADLNSFIKTAPGGQTEFMQFQADKNCTDSESEFFQSQTTSTEGTEMSSQGSLKVDIFDRLNTLLKDIDLEPFSFPQFYSGKPTQQRQNINTSKECRTCWKELQKFCLTMKRRQW